MPLAALALLDRQGFTWLLADAFFGNEPAPFICPRPVLLG